MLVFDAEINQRKITINALLVLLQTTYIQQLHIVYREKFLYCRVHVIMCTTFDRIETKKNLIKKKFASNDKRSVLLFLLPYRVSHTAWTGHTPPTHTWKLLKPSTEGNGDSYHSFNLWSSRNNSNAPLNKTTSANKQTLHAGQKKRKHGLSLYSQ